MVSNSICALWILFFLMAHECHLSNASAIKQTEILNSGNLMDKSHDHSWNPDLVFDFFNTDFNMTDCGIENVYPDISEDDDRRCRHIWYFDEDVVKIKNYDEWIPDIKYCACQLIYMNEWEYNYRNTEISRLGVTVRRQLERAKARNKPVPDYLWSDMELVAREISILSSTRDFYYQQRYNPDFLFLKKTRENLLKDGLYKLIEKVCKRISEDPDELYGRLESILRLNPMIFYNAISLDPLVLTVHDASRACKLMLKSNLTSYRLKADQTNYMLVKDLTKPKDLNSTIVLKKFDTSDDPNFKDLITSTDLDRQLSSASAALLNCGSLIKEANSLNRSLASSCPEMLSRFEPRETRDFKSESQLSLHAIRCGCLLLRHSDVFSKMMSDPNVEIMSRALINHLNENRMPNFSKTPIWALYGWFERIIKKFVYNKKITIDEVVKEIGKDEDPYRIQKQGPAIDVCRKACNFIKFNYRKEQKVDYDLRAVQYLDNLKDMSRDPLFVFHLTLQDANLFKIYALSKLCQPFFR